MNTIETFGHPGQPMSDQCEYLTLVFSPLSAPLRSRWRNNGLSADFLGDYVTTFLPSNGFADDGKRQTEIQHAVAYVANELLENAMKYHERENAVPIGIHLELAHDHITVSASNGIGKSQADLYKEFAENIVSEDAGELLTKQLELSAQANDAHSSCLGLLTIINDYGAELGWKFEISITRPEAMTVTTSAVLPLTQFLGASA
jgi:hypothetical protein